jgi:hypothetical protein
MKFASITETRNRLSALLPETPPSKVAKGACLLQALLTQ